MAWCVSYSQSLSLCRVVWVAYPFLSDETQPRVCWASYKSVTVWGVAVKRLVSSDGLACPVHRSLPVAVVPRPYTFASRKKQEPVLLEPMTATDGVGVGTERLHCAADAWSCMTHCHSFIAVDGEHYQSGVVACTVEKHNHSRQKPILLFFFSITKTNSDRSLSLSALKIKAWETKVAARRLGYQPLD